MCVAASSALPLLMAQAQSASGGAATFQALFIFNFTKYITYPPSRQNGDFIIGILGKPDLIPPLEKTAAIKKVNGVQTIKVYNYEDIPNPTDCHIIFVSSTHNKRLPRIVEMARNKPILVVTEGQGMYSSGSGISILSSGDKKFEVNRAYLEANGMKVSSELLKLAAIVP